MRITADIEGILAQHDPVFREFLLGLWDRIVSAQPESHFNFLYGKNSTGFQPAASNGSGQALVPRASSLRYRYWQLIQLPALLKKTNSDLFVSSSLYPLAAKNIPQVWVPGSLDDLPRDRAALRTIQSLQSIIVYSAAWKKTMMERYGIPEKKMIVLAPALPFALSPLSFEEKQAVKARYTQGREYFLYPGAISGQQNLLNLFKGFSLFKKRQQSGIKLVLADEIPAKEKAFAESLNNYKYREDVIITGSLPPAEKQKIIAAAYAMADPAHPAGPGLIALQSAAAGVALLAGEEQPLPEEAYLSADMSDPVDIASRFMQVYKDESLRNQLFKTAAAAVYPDMDQAAAAFWTALTRSGG